MSAPDVRSDPWTYFGIWSVRDSRRVSGLLDSLSVRFQFTDFEATQEILEEWHAWDSLSSNPNTAVDLWIHDEDVAKVGHRIVTEFPERKFGAP